MHKVTEHTRKKDGGWCIACSGYLAINTPRWRKPIKPGERYRFAYIDEEYNQGPVVSMAHVKCVEGSEWWAITGPVSPLDDDSLDYVRRAYGVPARAGGRVCVEKTGEKGTIHRGSAYVYVLLDGQRRAAPYHPKSLTYEGV